MKTNVLVVDDDNHMRIALKESLVRAGYNVALAEDGKKAMVEIERRIYDLVITDVKMPHIGGIDLLKAYQRDIALYAGDPDDRIRDRSGCSEGHERRGLRLYSETLQHRYPVQRRQEGPGRQQREDHLCIEDDERGPC